MLVNLDLSIVYGIWFVGEKEDYVSEADHAASMYEEMQKKDLNL